MRARRLRRRDLLLTLVAVATVAATAAIGAAVGDQERVTRLWVGAALDPASGDLEVTEVIDYDFGLASRHGIYRDIPDLVVDAAVTVSSPTAPDDVSITYGGLTRLRVGDPGRTISRLHRYTLGFRIERGAVADGNTFNWNAVGSSWSVPIEEVEIHLSLPFRITTAQCHAGDRFSVGGCTAVIDDTGAISVDVDRVDPGEAVTLDLGLGATRSAPPLPIPPSGPGDDPGSGLVPPALAAALAALAGAVPAAIAVRRAGREQVWSGGAADAAFGPGRDAPTERLDERALAELATIEFESPRGMSAVEGAIIVEETVRDHHLTAWVLESAIRDEVRLEVTGGDATVLRRGGAAPAPSVAVVLDQMFGERDEIDLDSHDRRFQKGWERLSGELTGWYREADHWDPTARRRRRLVIGAAVVAAAIGAVVVFVGALLANRAGTTLSATVLGGLLFGAGASALVRSWELHVRTPQGSARWLQVESFRRFLHESETRHVEYAAEMGVLRQYTAWAVALDETDSWTAAITATAAARPQLATVHSRDLAFAAAAPGLARAARVAATPPASSGGGGAGGFSGGGGGGGGGGSW